MTERAGCSGLVLVRAEGAAVIRPVAVRLRDVPAFLGIGRSKVQDLVRTGELPSLVLDGCRLVRMVDLEAFVERLLEEQE